MLKKNRNTYQSYISHYTCRDWRKKKPCQQYLPPDPWERLHITFIFINQNKPPFMPQGEQKLSQQK